MSDCNHESGLDVEGSLASFGAVGTGVIVSVDLATTVQCMANIFTTKNTNSTAGIDWTSAISKLLKPSAEPAVETLLLKMKLTI